MSTTSAADMRIINSTKALVRDLSHLSANLIWLLNGIMHVLQICSKEASITISTNKQCRSNIVKHNTSVQAMFVLQTLTRQIPNLFSLLYKGTSLDATSKKIRVSTLSHLPHCYKSNTRTTHTTPTTPTRR